MGVLSRLVRVLASVGWLAVGIAPAWAGPTGTIRGTVVDAKSGGGIAAAAVIGEGTKRGGVTDANGTYQIPFIEGGTYNITARAAGHRSVTLSGQTIIADFTNTVNFRLDPEAVQQEAVIVSGQRPIIERSATSTVRYVTSAEVQKLPTRGYQQVDRKT